MSNWPLKFNNSQDDSPAQFLNDLYRFKRGYQITDFDILENLDAVLSEEALEWCRVYINEKFNEEIINKIKFCNKKKKIKILILT